MANFFKFNSYNGNGLRLKGIPRYSELLGRDFKRFFLTGLLTLLGILPYAAGVLFSVLYTSVLLLTPVCIIGGIITGPFLSCMYDVIFRSLRDAPGKWFDNYKKAWKQNWRQSLIPGIIFCLLLGFYIFMAAMFWWSVISPGIGTYAVSIVGFLLFTMFFTVYWPLLVLFDLSGKDRFRNSILFSIRYFWKVTGCAILQILYWAAIILFFPASMIILPFLGIWFILFTVNFLLFNTMNETFHIEEKIAEAFPEQAAFYEDDETWLKRKQQEE